MKLDIHSHQRSDNYQVLVGHHTLGIHPWELTLPYDQSWVDKKWEELMKKDGPIFAIGECGLDRVHTGIVSIEEQKRVLLKHFEEAKKREIPLILHSVRSYSDVLGMLKKIKFPFSILLHAYGGNEQEMHELLKYPVYFSYGARLFHNDKMLRITPLDKLLLETGDQSEYSIEDIYQKASEGLSIPMDELEKRLEKNFLSFFGKHDDLRASDFIKNFDMRPTHH